MLTLFRLMLGVGAFGAVWFSWLTIARNEAPRGILRAFTIRDPEEIVKTYGDRVPY